MLIEQHILLFMERNETNKKYAKFLAGALGFNPTVYPYYDDSKIEFVDILSIDDPIDAEVKFYSSIGVANYPNIIEMNDGVLKDISVELIITGYKKFEKTPNILATASFYITKNNWTCQPGTVYKSIIQDYYNTELKHILFTSPFLWEDKLSNLSFDNKEIHPLLLIPISDKELEYKLSNGYSALERLFEENEIDIFDLDRKSIL